MLLNKLNIDLARGLNALPPIMVARGQARAVAAVVNLFRLLERHPELLDDLKTG